VVNMVVDLYAVDHGYGFCVNETERYFFRVEDFGRGGVEAPLPICGERVVVGRIVQGGKSPQAMSICRLDTPTKLVGQVKSFDSGKGWGFVEHDNRNYFLHKSDLTTPFTPIIGSHITFYAGMRRGKPRACYVTPHTG